MGKWDSLSGDQQDQIAQAFEICDQDHNGFIDIHELKEVLVALGQKNATDQQAKELMKQIDSDGNGLIDFDEFKEQIGHGKLVINYGFVYISRKKITLRTLSKD
ncbi:calmodulin-like protein [Acrasis kona]|uniref:Calmodulin-like protein n=1 Tax=Acrasis kona TaxID=1008807 RepID=A0AAW2ZHY2_9EUKA